LLVYDILLALVSVCTNGLHYNWQVTLV